ncbi:MAG TPA: cupin domain-containing protein [Tepidisphaeraceae bacterium]|nr:cupin domain-containing protein [Tepidisphaeraceae bacterium]
MSDPDKDGGVTRRKVLAGLSAAAVLPALVEAQQSASPPSDTHSQNTGGKPTNPLQDNEPIIAENPDSWTPPPTDSGDVNTFKYPFAFGHNRVSKGGWARQVTVRDLAISTTIAGVNMRLEKGAVRELHWHIPAEWAYMLQGTARITGVDPEGRSFVSDVSKGDLWYFPGGVPHSIQGVSDDGCEFLLVFDDGKFSEFDTFLITDWMAHTPPEILAKNFGMPQSTFNPIPKKELYIFPAPVPASLEEDIKKATGPAGFVKERFDYHLTAQRPDKKTRGGEVRIADSSRFKASVTIAVALVKLNPGGLRELHWHPNADEWQYYVTGKGRMTVFTGGGKARTMDFQRGDVGYIQQSLPHYIENTGDEGLEFLEIFRSDKYQDISLAEWISHLPPELVAAHLKLPQDLIESIPKEKRVITPA